MEHCTLCPVACGADRSVRAGYCGVKALTVAKYYLHPFEEPPISHKNGSGTVFFGGCSLRCVFCQNFALSRAERGKAITPKELAGIFRELEEMGADNINLVTPDHVSPYIAEALALYKPRIPVVYNSGGYCKVSALEEIDPYIDVYLPDVKFFSPELSEHYTGRRDYFAYCSEAVRFMAKKPVRRSEDDAPIRAHGRHCRFPRTCPPPDGARIPARRGVRPCARLFRTLHAGKGQRGQSVHPRVGLLIQPISLAFCKARGEFSALGGRCALQRRFQQADPVKLPVFHTKSIA